MIDASHSLTLHGLTANAKNRRIEDSKKDCPAEPPRPFAPGGLSYKITQEKGDQETAEVDS